MSRAIDAAPPSNASVVPVGHRPARQLKPILIDARDRQNQRPLLRDSYAATIMGSPRHWPSHPDCRCLLTQIAALQGGKEGVEIVVDPTLLGGFDRLNNRLRRAHRVLGEHGDGLF